MDQWKEEEWSRFSVKFDKSELYYSRVFMWLLEPVIKSTIWYQSVYDAETLVYKIEEGVDVRDRDTGPWFEARIKMIKKNDTVCGGDGLAYYVQYEGYPHYGPVQ